MNKGPQKRSRILALFLSFLQPGLGHLYIGEGKKTFAIFLFITILLSLLCFTSIPDTFYGISSCLLGGFALFFWCLYDSGRELKEPVTLKWYNKWYVYLGFVVVVQFIANITLIHVKSNRYEAFKIPSSSSIPTLMPGDYISTSKEYYASHPISRFDMAVFHIFDDPSTPKDESKIKIIKRIIGLGGETIEVRGTKVFINGAALVEPYAVWEEAGIPEGNYPPTKIPDGTVFFLGDNRDHSRDSRFWATPFIPVENIVGKVLYVYWSEYSFDRIGTKIE